MAPRFWTPERLHTIEDCIEAGMSDTKIGARLGCTGNAVNIARKRHRIKSRLASLLTARKVAALLGVDSKAVTWWIQSGYLKARRGQRIGQSRMWHISEDALQRFLENPAYWHLWQPERVTDRDWREWAQEMRRERFLSTGEVGKRLAVCHGTVNNWINMGLLPAVRRGNWFVRESDLTGFVPPCERSKRGTTPRRFVEAEDEQLRLGVADGLTLHKMAAALGRNMGSVAGRIKRLGLRETRLL